MPPCRRICTGRLVPTPLPAAEADACCAVPVRLGCSCGEEPEASCDEDTCANAADCKQLHPDFCPHGLASDEDCTSCQPQLPARPELTLICPHCRSQISMFEDPKLRKDQSTTPQNHPQAPKTWLVQKPPSYTRSSPLDSASGGNDGRCASSCPSKKQNQVQRESSDSPLVSCSESSCFKPRSPHISQIKVTKGEDHDNPHPPPPAPPDNPMNCCMNANGIRTAPHMGRASAREGIAREGTGPRTSSEMAEPEAPDCIQVKKGTVMGNESPQMQCKICMQAAAGAPRECCPMSVASQPDPTSPPRAAGQPQKGSQTAGARPARGSSGKGKDEEPAPSPLGPNPDCPRSGAGALFPARPPPQACLCRMPPAYTTGCTGNLAGNCNCATCNK